MSSALLAGLTLSIVIAVPAAAHQPMDIGDPTPRWVQVAFELSPQDRPGQVDTVYSFPYRAQLEPGPHEGTIKVTLPSEVVERDLLQGYEPVPGSFSDFEWVFDARTGAVGSASVSGTVRRTLHWGLTESRVLADIEIRMGTHGAAGFRRPTRLLGNVLHRYCEEPASASECTLIHSREYDRQSGYVNAVGAITVRYLGVALKTFSPLGEAVFTELGPPLENGLASQTPLGSLSLRD